MSRVHMRGKTTEVIKFSSRGTLFMGRVQKWAIYRIIRQYMQYNVIFVKELDMFCEKIFHV
jgi:hypothetical protein